jgi:hypothetical protein
MSVSTGSNLSSLFSFQNSWFKNKMGQMGQMKSKRKFSQN